MAFDKNTSMGRTNRSTVQDAAQGLAANDQSAEPSAIAGEDNPGDEENEAQQSKED